MNIKSFLSNSKVWEQLQLYEIRFIYLSIYLDKENNQQIWNYFLQAIGLLHGLILQNNTI